MNESVSPSIILSGYSRDNLPEHPSVGMALLHTAPDDMEALVLSEWFVPDDLTEYDALKNKSRRIEWLAARVALKRMLAEDGMLESPLHAHIRKNAKGAPHLVIYNPDTGRYAQLACSLSHKGSLALAAYSRDPGLRVGADIERRSWRLARLRRDFLHESDLMADKDDTTGGFTVLWSFKEAATKLLGVGKAYGFAKVQCRETATGACELRDVGGNHYSGRYRWFGKYAVVLVTDPPRLAGTLALHAPRRKYTLLERIKRWLRLRRIRKAKLAR